MFCEWEIGHFLSTTLWHRPQKMNRAHQINHQINTRVCMFFQRRTPSTQAHCARLSVERLMKIIYWSCREAFRKCITQTCLLGTAIVAWRVTRAPSLHICTCSPCPWIPCMCVCGWMERGRTQTHEVFVLVFNIAIIIIFVITLIGGIQCQYLWLNLARESLKQRPKVKWREVMKQKKTTHAHTHGQHSWTENWGRRRHSYRLFNFVRHFRSEFRHKPQPHYTDYFVGIYSDVIPTILHV